jgi:hypothetical protein
MTRGSNSTWLILLMAVFALLPVAAIAFRKYQKRRKKPQETEEGGEKPGCPPP